MLHLSAWIGVLSILLGTLAAPPAPVSTVTSPGHGAGSVTIAFTGDTLIHYVLTTRARTDDGYDFRPMFAKVRPIIAAADLAICHLEVPLSPTDRDLSGYPLFSAPHELADALAFAGFDGCSTASNHSYDRGEAGVIDTIAILQKAGIKEAGMASSAYQAFVPVIHKIGDLTVAHISATYWLNGLRMPPDRQWLVQLLVEDQIKTMAARAKRAGADLVVVSAHCCTEYQAEPTPNQRELFTALIRSPDIDLVVGHHSHMIGPVEMVGGEFILYGLGNFLSLQRHPPPVADGVIAMVSAEKLSGRWRFVDVSVIPTWVEPGTSRIVPAMTANSVSYLRTMAMVNLYEGVSVGPFMWPGHPAARLPET